MEDRVVRDTVREGYAKIVEGSGCCGPNICCGGAKADDFAKELGYSEEDLAALPEGANLGLGCGNPTALTSLAPGEVVLDLGSGAGLDVFIAARKVGPAGRAIGVDMTPEMVSRARANAAKAGVANTEFRLGEIENLPVADGSVDVVISNCVINLSPDKARVFREIARTLKPGGRVAVSDMALLRPLPEEVRKDVEAYIGCISGAVEIDAYTDLMRDAGLVDVEVNVKKDIDPTEDVQDPLYRKIKAKLPAGTRPTDFIVSIDVRARRPAR
jgi:SAM-dependent methyltransferase